ncbi:3-keto-5-aminohexanoate cleavage protein [Marivibrio halodurans]|uniref:3-keto-5-aminohexanoate cleavage protein n=1 Tax=Marivibrio halodurans TaxID=2039722 RepID=A0A8J7V1Z5_9PROT|nr:3-keto-5-aminohexanoate cleavage protein [Marivibrio halodurans]MBP5856332.1 3-keto-5-aminohexanoate cleavage protein [Marivibrio halodurans]
MMGAAGEADATWLEVALNGPWGPAAQPRAPVTVADCIAEGVACAKAGAAIIHVHAFDPETGRQNDDWQTYARIIEGIRDAVDAIVYPTLPFNGAAGHGGGLDVAARYAHTVELATRGLIEWSVVDPGTVQIADFDRIADDRPGFVYSNPEDHVREGLRLAGRYGFHPGYAIYEPGFLRFGAALAQRYPDAPRALYRFMFSDRFSFGFPPREWALASYIELLRECAPGAPWMVAGLQVDITGLIPAAVAAGGHVRVGLEDAVLGLERGNIALAEDAAALIHRAGGRLADAATVRRMARGAAD